ncbi:inner centromere protein-like [Montipora foliosa]|uniref:inner centromere protein-like n=1 Tax=Montipora foliosa TaxID=591990 RepID=UPI0035F1BA29
MTLPILGAAVLGKAKAPLSSTIFHLYHPPFWNLQSFHLIGFWKQTWPIAIDVSRPVKSKQHVDFPRKSKFPQILWLKRAVNMVRHLDINYVFKHPFEKVTRAYFKKYSCGKETNVTAITVLKHKIDPETAEEYVVRRGECVNVLPGILRKFAMTSSTLPGRPSRFPGVDTSLPVEELRVRQDGEATAEQEGKKKDEEDKKKANEFRDKAMETLKRKSSTSGSENSDDEGAAGPSDRKPKKTKQRGRPDVMSYLSEKKELEQALRTQELEYKRDALEAETKLKQEQLEVEKRRISLQEQQMNMQLELLKAFMTSKK